MNSRQETSLSQSVPFDQGWTLEDTRDLLDQAPFPRNGTPTEQEAWRREIGQPGDKRLAKAIGRHMAHLMQQGRGVLPANCEGINTRFLHYLRELESNPNKEEFQIEVGRPFVRNMLVYILLDRAKSEAADVQGVHEELVALIGLGDFKSVMSDDQVCHSTGLHINVQLNQWNGVAGTHKHIQDPDRSWGRLVFEPLDPATLEVPQTYTQSIPVPSGKLWISDWFRIGAFNELTKPLDDEGEYDELESISGRAAVTRRYAERLGIGHVFCKSPDIVSSMGAITAGKCHTDKESWDPILPAGHVGKIDADLRWTTVVDREHLVDLLTPQLGREGAVQQVDDYEANTPDIIKIDVAPGHHHLYFAGDGRTLGQTIGQNFESEGLFLDEDYSSPGFALTHQPLQELSARPARKPGPGVG